MCEARKCPKLIKTIWCWRGWGVVPAVLRQVLFLKPNFLVCNVPDACRKGDAEINWTSSMSSNSLLSGCTVPWLLHQNLWKVPREKSPLALPMVSRQCVQTVYICSMQVGPWSELRGVLLLREEAAVCLSTNSCKGFPDISLTRTWFENLKETAVGPKKRDSGQTPQTGYIVWSWVSLPST